MIILCNLSHWANCSHTIGQRHIPPIYWNILKNNFWFVSAWRAIEVFYGKGIFLDFYGTIVHEDGEVIKKITQIIVETGKAGFCNQGVIDEVWYSILRDELMKVHI